MADVHDALFKKTFGDPVHAGGQLKSMLPQPVADKLDWSTLELRPGSFVDQKLSKRHTDLLYRVSTADHSDNETYLYLLFEHQSRSDPLMALRLLTYVTRIWEAWIAEHEAAAGAAAGIPPVIPLVLYHGAARWSAAADLTELLQVRDELRDSIAPWVPSLRYVVEDLSVADDDELKTRAVTALAKLVMWPLKHGRHDEDILAHLVTWHDVLKQVLAAHDGISALTTVLRYILRVNGSIDTENVAAVLDAAVGPAAKQAAMTAGERLIQQGLEQGLEQGLRSGCRALITVKMGHVDAENGAEIEAMLASISHADTLQALMAALTEAPDAATALTALEHVSRR